MKLEWEDANGNRYVSRYIEGVGEVIEELIPRSFFLSDLEAEYGVSDSIEEARTGLSEGKKEQN